MNDKSEHNNNNNEQDKAKQENETTKENNNPKNNDNIHFAEYKEQFIPIRKEDLIDLICDDDKLNEEQQKKFKEFCTILENILHKDFNEKLSKLKRHYYPLNPDLDIIKVRDISKQEIQKDAHLFTEGLREVLTNANYENITEEELNKALKEHSLYNVSLLVDFDDFEEYILYKRGETIEEVEIKKLFGLIKKTKEVRMYERVVIYLRFKDEDYFVNKALGKYDTTSGNKIVDFLTKVGRIFKTKKRDKILKKLSIEPNSTVLKLFKKVPKADIEMLFPNTRIFMNIKDMMFMGIPAVVGLVSAFVTKFISSIGTIIAVIFVFFVTKDWNQNEMWELLKTVVRGFAAIGAFGGYIIRQWGKYKNKKINFMKELSENLYFKNLDNNMGVFATLIDSAESQEFKEAVLAYYFMLIKKEPVNDIELDGIIEEWITSKINVEVDFEISDALNKLNKLKLTEKSDNDKYTVVSLDESLKRMDYLWDNYFVY